MPIYLVILEKKQRFEVIRGVRGIYQCVLHTPHDSNPACDLRVTMLRMLAALCVCGCVFPCPHLWRSSKPCSTLCGWVVGASGVLTPSVD